MSLRPGARFGPYEILALVGAGGMGEVYRARDTRLGREVAVKVLHLTASDAEIEQRMQREAELIASLSHPHICHLYDIGNEGGMPFLVMEFLEGETLAARLTRGALPLEQALRYGVQIASAIDAAHRRGVVHRDLKPGNVMLTRAGAKLLDFGLAKPGLAHFQERAARDSAAETTPVALSFQTTVGGTLPYMAPEQMESKEADARADLFSFGAVLYEMVTGRRAFLGDTPGRIVAAVMTDEPPRMAQFQPAVPPALEELVSTCLAKDRDERWQSAHDLARTLQWIAEGSASVSREEAANLLRNAARGIPRPRWTVAAAALAIITVAGVASWRALPLTAGSRNIVVLPCRSVNGQSDQAFCDGLAETLTARLAQLSAARDLQVVPASHVRSERVTTVDEARTMLGATLTLEGSLLRAGDALRLNYVLVDPRTHHHVDAVSLTASAGDPFALHDAIVDWAIKALQIPVSASERQAMREQGTKTAEAYVLLQEGRGRLLAHQTPADLDAAIDLLSRAVKADGQYAAAHAGLAEAYWRRYEATPEASWAGLARESCARAKAINPKLLETLMCQGRIALGTGATRDALSAFQDAVAADPANDDAQLGLARALELAGDGPAAERAYRKAVADRPHYWRAHAWLGHYLLQHARYDEALGEYQRAVQLNPGNAGIHALLGGVQMYLGRYSDAVAEFRASTGIVPTYGALLNWGMTHFRMREHDRALTFLTRACEIRPGYQCIGNLARVYRWSGKLDEARTLTERAAQLAGQELAVNASDVDARLSAAEYSARLGRRDDAAGHLAKIDTGQNAHRIFFVALAHTQLGDVDRALEALGRAVDAGLPSAELRAWPELDPLRKEPRFIELSGRARSRAGGK